LLDVVDEFVVRGREGYHVCLVMKLVGPELFSFIPQYRKELPYDLPERAIMCIGVHVAQALSFLHRQGIVHGDVQPHNITFQLPFEASSTNVSTLLGEPEAIGESFCDMVNGGAFEVDTDDEEEDDDDSEGSEEEDPYSGLTVIDHSEVSWVGFQEVARGINPAISPSGNFQSLSKNAPQNPGNESNPIPSEGVNGNATQHSTPNNKQPDFNARSKYGPDFYILSPDPSVWWPMIVSQADPKVTLIDYTCSFFLKDSKVSDVRIRTPDAYAPPEASSDTFKPLYSTESDMWSLGCILFVLFSRTIELTLTSTFIGSISLTHHFVNLAQILGKGDPLPDCFLQLIKQTDSESADLFEGFHDHYENNDWGSIAPEGFCWKLRDGTLDERLQKARDARIAEGWDERNVDLLVQIIKGTLKWDPKERLKAEEVVECLARSGLC